MLRVLLNNPPVKKIEEPWYDTPDFGRAGLAYVAGYLRAHLPACEVVILDSKFERLDFDQTLARIKEFEPDLVGFTAFTNEIKPAAAMSELIKAWRPSVLSVIGGVHVTALPRETLLEFPTFDLAVNGEGEITFYELCRALAEAGDAGDPAAAALDDIDGLVFRRGDEIVLNRPRQRMIDLDAIPFPAWDLLPPAATYFIQVSRGCPFACKFCMNPNGKIARRRSVPNVIAELEDVIENYGPTDIWYGDEIFTVDIEHTRELLKAKIAAGIPEKVRWSAVTHVRFVDEDLFRLMSNSNVALVGFGIETGDEETLKKIGKGTTIELITKMRAGARKYKVPITTYMIIGQPNESVASIRKSIDLAVKLNPELPIFGIMVPYPGTEVSRLAARGEAGYRLLTRDWDAYNKQIGGALEFANLSRFQIEFYQLYAYVKVFLWNFRFLDLAKFVWKFRTAGFAVVFKMLGGLFRRRPVAAEPTAADEIHNNDAIARATEAWQKWQTSELVRAKNQDPGKYAYRSKLRSSS